MLYFKCFYDYESFKSVFGVMEHGNGNKSRRNKILLAMMKDKKFFDDIRHASLKKRGHSEELDSEYRERLVNKFRSITTMADLRMLCLKLFTHFKPYEGYDCNIYLGDNEESYNFAHPDYTLDNNGVCYDGDTRSIRYVNRSNDNHIYKMRAGKFLRRLIESSQWHILPEQVKVWLCEDFAERWQAFSSSKVSTSKLYLSTDLDDFKKIYDSDEYESDFGSCMSHGGGDHASFYVDAVKAKAAWLENSNGKIVARCVVFTDVEDEDGNKWRLAERQYSSDGDNALKRMLVDKLIAAGEIDGYKQVGVDCHNARAYVANDGTSLENKHFKIECNLEDDDVLSYQDSFKWYDMDEHTAYNYCESGADYDLADTDLYFRPHYGKVYSEYEGEWIAEDEAVWVDGRDDYYYYCDTYYCENTQTREFKEDCVQLANGDYAYYGRDCEGYDGVYECEECGEYFLEDDIEYSELVDRYLCHSCREDAEQEYMKVHAEEEGYRYDEFSRKWYDPEEEEDVRILVWNSNEGKRKNGWTRKVNLTMFDDCFLNYKGNWYCRNLYYSSRSGIRLPFEIFLAGENM